jgi:drug/metabolite transporter (DMT)-like permease
MLGGLPVVLPLAARQSGQVRWEGVSWGTVAGIVYVAFGATAAAMFLWNYAFAHLESGTAALTFFTQPVVGVLVGVLWLGDALTWPFVLGGALIGVGMYLAAVAPVVPVEGGEHARA